MTCKSALWIAFAIAAVGCGSAAPPADATPADASPPDGTPPDGSCTLFDYSTYVVGATQVSFESDVVPIFGTSCAFSTCHAREQNPMGGLYLGPNVNNTAERPSSVRPFYPPDAVTRAKIRGGLVGAKSKLAVTMLLVQPGSPKDSFLMHKIDGDQGCAGIACNPIDTGECGESMPQRSNSLEPGASAIVRDWIAQGANEN